MASLRRHLSLYPVLAYAALTSSVVSSLGMLLVPNISHEMNVSIGTAQWMLTINLLVGAVATPIMGRLSDGPHKKALLLWSIAIILTGSLVAALAPNFLVFLIGRALQGLSYGIVPVTISLARRYLPGEDVRAAVSSLSVIVATGLGIGYPLTGLLASAFGFRSAFVFAVIFLITAGGAVWVAAPAGPDEQAPRRPLDIQGATLLGLGLAALVVTVSEGARWGWGSAGTLMAMVIAVSALAGWSRFELRTPNPLINLRAIRSPDVLLAHSTAIGLGAAMYIGLSIASLIGQSPATSEYGLDLTLSESGFVMLPLSIGSLGANRFVRCISRYLKMSSLLLCGAAVVTGGATLIALAHDELWEILIGMFLFGVGIGMTYAAMPALIARSVAAEELGSAVSFNQVLRTVGGTFGSAVSGAVLATHMAPDLHPTEGGIALALEISAIGSAVVLLGISVNSIRFWRRDH
ncbi:MFS transporter [Mycolicibacterium goodii]|uniref:MFS transporter n=2 Tax=Mycolicibacterium goodii TaxID=134601 RepID=A0A0K0XGE6_MYCGD|nr:MFS transporter [Mycolicibacterium goodii]